MEPCPANPTPAATDVFDEVAEDYDRHRPTYPDVLVYRACEGIGPGTAVLEIGCGTGQLAHSLLAAADAAGLTPVWPTKRVSRLPILERGMGRPEGPTG